MKRILIVLFFFTQILQASDSLTLKSIFRDFVYYPRSVRGINSMNDGIHFSRIEGNSIVKYEYRSGEKQSVIFDGSEFKKTVPVIKDYAFSEDERKILISTNAISQYRHSFFATYYIYYTDSHELKVLKEGKSIMLATFSPDGKKIGFVYENNLYYYNLETGQEFQITTDGQKNQIINGTTDWVYEEEFAFTQGFHWSPESDKIAYYRFDESNVKEYTLQYYSGLYPKEYTYKYPKAGEDNSLIEIWTYDLNNSTKTKNDLGTETDIYIPRIKWTHNNNHLAIIRLNRLQNHVDVLLADEKGETDTLFSDDNQYYISEIDDDYLVFLKNGNEFIVKSEKDGFMHFYRYNMDGKFLNQVTKGEWDLDQYYGIDETTNTLYYSSAEEIAYEKQVYKIQLDGTKKTKLTSGHGIHTASFSNDFSYYIHTFTNSTTPKITDLYNKKGKMVRVLEDNADLKNKLTGIGLNQKEFIKVKTEDDIELNGYLIKPLDFDPNKKYPVLMFVYGGPEAQDAMNSYDGYWDIWFRYLNERGYMVACFDNRGTDSRGQEFKKATYMQLGKLETIDQKNVAKHLGDLPFVDAKRIGIIGWSYGGYLSSLCLFKGEGLFSLAVAIAPVTNWRYYDNIYTERFMRTPQENPDGYDNNSPVNFAGQMEGKFMLVHGMADDNVHLQNSVELSEQLIQHNKQFEMLYYPNRDHGIYGKGSRLHLFTGITDFILENL